MIVMLLACLGWSQPDSFAAASHQYLLKGHPREDEPGEIVQRAVERVDFSGG